MWLNCRNCGRKFDYNGRGSVHGRRNLRACCPSCGSSVMIFKKSAPKFVKPVLPVDAKQEYMEEGVHDIPSIDELIPPIVSYSPEEQQRLRREAEQQEENSKSDSATQERPIIIYTQPPAPPKTRQEEFVSHIERLAAVNERIFGKPEDENSIYGLDLPKLLEIKRESPKMARMLIEMKLRNSEEFHEDMAQADRTVRRQRVELENKELNNSFADAIYHYSRLGKRDFIKKQTGMTDAQIDEIISEVNAGKAGNKNSTVDKALKRYKRIEKMEDPAKFLLGD